ncbi:MAG: HAD family hydrolase [Limnochordia bacterium]|mgnify:CR=1 FL=1|jgi:phosphoglycolate phosphatase
MSQRPSVGLIFDLDNTLVASRIDFTAMRAAVFDVLREAGVSVTDEQRRWPVGRLAELARRAGDDEANDSYARIWQLIEHYEVEGMKKATLEDGARQVTETLAAQGYPLAIVTNNSRASALAILQAFDLTDPFRVILAREDVPRLKPAPDGLLLARQHLGSPERAFMIGDAWLDGVAAQAAEARFVAVGAFRQGPTPCPVWAQIDELPELLELDWWREQ